MRLFADDINLLISGKDINDSVGTTPDTLESLSVWFRHNQQTLSLNKTCDIIFSRQLDSTVVSLLLQDKQIELVYSVKYMGIYLDCKLSWSGQIKELCIKVSKLSGVFHHIAINADRVRQLHYAYVFRHIN